MVFKLLQILLKYKTICLSFLNIFQVHIKKKTPQLLQVNNISSSLSVALLTRKCTENIHLITSKSPSLFYYLIIILTFKVSYQCQIINLYVIFKSNTVLCSLVFTVKHCVSLTGYYVQMSI